MTKRTIKAAAGESHVTAAAARAAARAVYRDSRTGKFVVVDKRDRKSSGKTLSLSPKTR